MSNRYLSGIPDQSWAIGMGALLAAVFVAFGLLTPLSLISLFVLMRQFDEVIHANTLGTTICMQLLILLVLVRAGRKASLDAWLFRRLPMKWPRSYYRDPSETQLKFAFSFAFVAYALMSGIAISHHLVDPYWTQALTVKALLVNSYLSTHYGLFRSIDHAAPWLLGLFSLGGGLAQSVFQVLGFPLMFFPAGRFFVKWQGFFFFLLSWLFINLSMLPFWELAIWWLIFFPRRVNASMVEIFFDDRCNLCRRTMYWLKQLDFSHRYLFTPASTAEPTMERYGF
ncbi:MAG: hypothetical protein ABUL49_01525, partial [bacterium]